LLLDRSRLARNAARMSVHVRKLGVDLRPHVKTAKSIDVLRALGEELPITVSTLAEARYFFDGGVADILYAVGIAPGKLPEVAALVRAGCKLRVILDTVEAADAVRRFCAAEDVEIEALIEIDSDGHRAGVDAEDPLLIEIGRRLGSSLAGVMTHCGASYDCRTDAEFAAISEQERSRTLRAAERLRAAGLACPIVSVGSTPSIHYATDLTGVTEARVGVYVFGDLVQANLGTCAPDDIAIGVLASVIGHNRPHGRVLLDAGFLAMSRDCGMTGGPHDYGYGAICDPVTGAIDADVWLSSTNQEHGIITARVGEIDFECFPIGSRVRILPNHACATAAAYDRYHVVDGGPEILAVWDRVNGW
jgi:D-serine deaminase-like pyridoxal phosphate-dependent protein